MPPEDSRQTPATPRPDPLWEVRLSEAAGKGDALPLLAGVLLRAANRSRQPPADAAGPGPRPDNA